MALIILKTGVFEINGSHFSADMLQYDYKTEEGAFYESKEMDFYLTRCPPSTYNRSIYISS